MPSCFDLSYLIYEVLRTRYMRVHGSFALGSLWSLEGWPDAGKISVLLHEPWQ